MRFHEIFMEAYQATTGDAMNPQNNMSVLAQITSWIHDRSIANLAKEHKIQNRSFGNDKKEDFYKYVFYGGMQLVLAQKNSEDYGFRYIPGHPRTNIWTRRGATAFKS